MKSHLRPVWTQRVHAGLVSSHLTCRTLIWVSLIEFSDDARQSRTCMYGSPI